MQDDLNLWVGGTSEAESAARLSVLVDAVRRSRLFLMIWMLIWIAFGVAYLMTVKPQFVATVGIMLEPRHIAVDGPEDERHFHQFALDYEQAETELRVLKSEQLLRPIFEQFHLAESAELAEHSDGFWQALAHRLHRFFPGAAFYDQKARAFLAFTNRVTVLRLGLSYIVEISYRSHDPDLAARVANAVAAGYTVDRLVALRARLDLIGGPYRMARGEQLSNEIDRARAAVLHGGPIADGLPLADIRILGEAISPLRKSYPKPGPTLLIAASFAAISGVTMVLFARAHGSGKGSGSNSVRSGSNCTAACRLERTSFNAKRFS